MDKRAFTLIEVAIVMVILGLIIGLGMPMMKMLMKSNKLHEDRNTVAQAKAALIGYAYEYGSFPNPDTASGYRLLPYDKLGVRQTDSHGNQLIYDVNNKLLKSATSDNIIQFCKNVGDEMKKSDLPKISYSGTQTPVAFIVISKGSNYKLDDLNKTGAKVSGGTRIYDNPTHTYGKDYDDIVKTYTFAELNKWCKDNGYSDNNGSGGGNNGNGTAFSNLASYVADIAKDFPSTPPKKSDLNLPKGYTYKKIGNNIIITDSNGREAIISYKYSGEVGGIAVGNTVGWHPFNH